MNTASVQSQVISFLRFPLVVFVLFIHSDFRGINSAWNPALLDTPFLHLASISLSLGNIIDFLSGSLAPLANPFFFFISGLLFFKGSDFSKKDYFDKLRSRTRSLLVPYVMWNAIFLVALFVAEQLQPGWTSAIGKPIAQFGITDFLLSFWDISLICNQGGIAAPVDITMWFVRDLIILVILSPAIFWSLRWLSSFKKPIAIIVLCASLLAADHIPSVPGLNPQAFAFFGFGAYFGINKTDFTALFRPFLLGGHARFKVDVTSSYLPSSPMPVSLCLLIIHWLLGLLFRFSSRIFSIRPATFKWRFAIFSLPQFSFLWAHCFTVF